MSFEKSLKLIQTSGALLVSGLFFAEMLDAYSIQNLAARRLLQFCAILISSLIFFVVLFKFKQFKFKFSVFDTFFVFICLFFIWLLLNTFMNCHPDFGSCLKDPFFLKRIVHHFLFLYVFIFSYFIFSSLQRHEIENIFGFVPKIVTLFCLLFIIDYYAIILDLDLLPRNNIGTSHGEILNRFYYYGYHRLIGTFREPSLAGVFLTLVLSLTFNEAKVLRKVILIFTLGLAASIISLFSLAILNAYYFIISLFTNRWRRFFELFSCSLLGYSLALLLMYEYPDYAQGNDYLTSRYLQIEKVPFSLSSLSSVISFLEQLPGRGFIFSFLSQNPPTLIGEGLVEPYLELQNFIGSEHIPGFLFAIIALFYQAGYLATGILVCLFMLIFILLNLKLKSDPGILFILGPLLLSMLLTVIFYGELPLIFSLIFAITMIFYKQAYLGK